MTDANQTMSTVLRYDDAPAGIDFLTRAFGFERVSVMDDGAGTVVHAELRWGSGWLMTGSAREDFPADRGAGSGIYVVIADADEHCATARAAGAEIVSEPFDTDYGSRDYAARDPEGNRWFFGTYMPGADAGASA
jgi:uncharacterized glyoxalase superfamily protein PhnB